jgi:hypothetical protein
MKKQNGSIFQPNHKGEHAQVPVTHGMSHMSHGQADQPGHHRPGELPRDGKGKLNRPTLIHGGMVRQVEGKTILGGGHTASTIKSGGQIIPSAKNAAVAGWGNSTVRSGNPMAHAPAGKNLAPVKPAMGMRSRSDTPAEAMHAIGQAILNEAFANSDADTRRAHGRK